MGNDQRSGSGGGDGGGSSSNNNNNNNNNFNINSSASSSYSGKKGKNKNSGGSSTEKPKQPQRGLGVAQLEKIRLQSQMASCGFLTPHHHPFFPSFGPPPHPPPPPPPPPPPLHLYQHVPEDMRIQGGYHHHPALHSNGTFGYPSPSMGSPSSFAAYPPNFMMGMGDHMERTGNIRYSESQSCNATRWTPTNSGLVPENQYHIQPPGMVTRHLLSHVEQNNISNGVCESLGGSSSQDSESSEKEELDLELKL